jgi:AcrR family transcriptional regulator
MIEIAAERGYGAVTVRRLTRVAGVSTRSFYENFGEKEECFLGTYEWLVRRAARRMVGSQKAGRDWRQRLHLGLRALARDLAADPEAARLLLVEVFAVGPSAQERMSRAEAIFEAVVKTSLAEAPEEAMPPPFASRAIIAGVTTVARGRLLAGQVEELPGIVDELVEWALSYACGAAASAEQRGRPAEPWVSRDFQRGLEEEEEYRHRQVQGDERALVLGAVAKLAANDGYAALAPSRICAAAGVSRKAFDTHFDGVEACFLAAVEQLSTEAISEAARESAGTESWAAGLYRAVAILCERIAHDRVLSRLAFVEGLPPGPDGMRHRKRLLVAVAERLRRSVPPEQNLSKLAAEASVGATWDAIHRQVAAGRAPRLPQQADRLTFLLLAPAIGGALATDTIRDGDERFGEPSRLA